MHVKKALAAYRSQKSGAKQRGIEFRLTFKQWCDFWGEDIDRRGVGRDRLQMQRPMDTGPYEIGNIYKGYPRQNSKTAALARRDRETAEGYRRVQAALNAAMFAESEPEPDAEPVEFEIFRLGVKSPYASRYRFVR